MPRSNYIEVFGAKVHNLHNISIKIPKNNLVVITGVSGSGKSSLAFDTIYAEGQRRYVESLSTYARQFLGVMEKADVERITGLSPAIAINQKVSSHNPRSTVGTITEIYGYIRLLFTHIGQPHCPQCQIPISSMTVEEIVEDVINNMVGTANKIIIKAPIIQHKKGEYKKLLENLRKEGFLRIEIDEIQYLLDEIDSLQIDKNRYHNIHVIIDRLIVPQKQISQEIKKRLTDAIELAISKASGEVIVDINNQTKSYSEQNTCPKCKTSYPRIQSSIFSFNSPLGACKQCGGLGFIKTVNVEDLYNPRLTIREGGIFPWANYTTRKSWILSKLEALAKQHKFSLSTPIGEYPQEIFDLIFYGKGAKPTYQITYTNRQRETRTYRVDYEGLIPEMEQAFMGQSEDKRRELYAKYMIDKPCPICLGKRLKPYSLAVTINNKNIDQVVNMDMPTLIKFINGIKPPQGMSKVVKPIKQEILSRASFLNSVGIGYITLARRANTLSGGETQRIRLASQIGSGLTGVLYVLDEPSIGLHPRDINKLIQTLKDLRDLGNTVIVVEHDADTIQNADWIIDIGPKAGIHGGKVIFEGTVQQLKKANTLTAQYISKQKKIGESIVPRQSQQKQQPKYITLHNASTHNLKNLTVKFPLNTLTFVTGVSGSGKSSLIIDTLYPSLKKMLNRTISQINTKSTRQQQRDSTPYITGIENIQSVIHIDQSPIGKTPRSNPATYTDIFKYIREIFAKTQEARARGYTAGRFSFNVKGGRCEKCKGDGQIKIEMQFMPDVYITCNQCKGKRYNESTLQIDYKGKNIADVLDMTVEEALDFFANISPLFRKLNMLNAVGLGYIKLGQPATTLSGGESQRVKLAKELSKVKKGHTIYILDEPTTGLHFADIDNLLYILRSLVDKGNTVIVIEHNTDMIKHADWIIDLGPEGGKQGGYVVAEGTVQDLINNPNSITGQFLKD